MIKEGSTVHPSAGRWRRSSQCFSKKTRMIMSLSQIKSVCLFHSSTRVWRNRDLISIYILIIDPFKIPCLSWSPSESNPTIPFSNMRTLFLLLSWISHAVAEFSKLPHTPTQEGAAALPTSLPPADTSAELYSSPLEPSPWTAAESSNNEPRCQQQASTSLSESTKSAIFSSNSIANCADHSPDQIHNPSKVKRSQLSKHQKKDSCPDQKALPPSGSDERGRPWPSFGDGVDIEKRILQLMLTQGVDGVADSTACWQDEYMQIPVCTPLRGFRQSPAQVVEPCRLCKRYFLPPAII